MSDDLRDYVVVAYGVVHIHLSPAVTLHFTVPQWSEFVAGVNDVISRDLGENEGTEALS